MQQGINAAPCEVKPDRDRVDTACAIVKEQKLWIIEFDIKGDGRGCAVVKASNPNEASRVLKSEGLYNSNSINYMIYRIEEIIPSPDTMLICEQVVNKE